MAQTAYTKRYVILARADLAAAANLAASHPDTADGGNGSQTFTVPLSASGNLPATAYWCSWQMTPVQAVNIRTRLVQHGATAAEVTPVPANTVPASRRFAIYDDATWPDPEAILTSLSLQRIAA
jgi:hypothetical protein